MSKKSPPPVKKAADPAPKGTQTPKQVEERPAIIGPLVDRQPRGGTVEVDPAQILSTEDAPNNVGRK